MTPAEDIKRMLEEAGMSEVNFLYRHTKPTIQKDGYRYEIFAIYEDEGYVYLDCIQVYPSYHYGLSVLKMDETWRKASWNKVRDLVDSGTRIARYYNS